MDVLARIIELRDARGWSEYQLAEKSGMAQSTIPSLEKICDAFDITLAQFFIENSDEAVTLNEKQLKLLNNCVKLSPEHFYALLHFLDTL